MLQRGALGGGGLARLEAVSAPPTAKPQDRGPAAAGGGRGIPDRGMAMDDQRKSAAPLLSLSLSRLYSRITDLEDAVSERTGGWVVERRRDRFPGDLLRSMKCAAEERGLLRECTCGLAGVLVVFRVRG